MSSRERRIDRRVNVRVPLRFRLLDALGAPEQTAESENISQSGMFFLTSFPLEVGMPLEVSLRMPPELVGQSKSDVKCLARVVHVQAETPDSGRSGIGLHIERYEAIPATRERWTN